MNVLTLGFIICLLVHIFKQLIFKANILMHYILF